MHLFHSSSIALCLEDEIWLIVLPITKHCWIVSVMYQLLLKLMIYAHLVNLSPNPSSCIFVSNFMFVLMGLSVSR